MSDQCKTEDDCDYPMWCRGKDKCRKAGSRAAPCSPFDLLMGQIDAIKNRSDVYRSEAEAEEDHTEAEKHMRVYTVLKELHRLGKHFEANSEDHLRA